MAMTHLERIQRNQITKASAKGYVAVEPAPYQLQIDIDGLEALTHFFSQFELYKKHLSEDPLEMKSMTPSKSAGCFHITLESQRPMTIEKRIMLQALLGSDIRRELWNWIRVRNGDAFPIIFFEKRI